MALFGYVVFLGFPLLWMLSMSFKGPRELVQLPLLHPGGLHARELPAALTEENHQFIRSGINSLKVAIVTALLTTMIGLPAAYVLARRRGVVTRVGLGWILISQMFPLILIIIPLFLLLRDLKLTNSHIGLVVVYMVWALPFVLWMLYSYVRGIPPDLEEAATVDGATRFQILTGIIAPLLCPGSSSRPCSRSSRPGTSSSSPSSCSRARTRDAAAPARAIRWHRGRRAIQAGRGRSARDHSQPPPLHDHPALAHARPPLGAVKG